MELQIRPTAQALRGEGAFDDIVNAFLEALLSRTDSRAVGLWRLEGDALRLLGFAANPDMSSEVQRDFADATKTVALTQTKLGIVSAVTRREPAFAYVQAGPDGLVDSASWLARFQAVESLSVPILHHDRIVGVLAVSTAYPFAKGDETWNFLTGLGEQLGQ